MNPWRVLSGGASLCLVVAACVEDAPDDPGGSPGPTSDSGGEASLEASSNDGNAASDAAFTDGPPGDGGGDSGALACSVGCPSGMKYCFGRCVSIDDPKYGCTATSCQTNVCLPNSTVATMKCSNGACAVGRCATGFADCDGLPGNGCESDLGSPATCGSCSNACAANQVCNGNTCGTACSFPKTNCGGACHDLSSDTATCGACANKTCPERNGTATCSNGTCSLQCDPGYTKCGSDCVDLANNTGGPCGACNEFCVAPGPATATRCVNSACVTTCTPGLSLCGSACFDKNSDPAHCGSCGNACGASQICLDGSCVAPSAMQVVAGLSAPEDIAVDASNIYWTDTWSNEVWQANKVTFAKTRLATGQAKPYRLATDSQFVYWTSNLGGAIVRAPIGGGASTVLYAANQPTAIAVDALNVYWADSGTRKIFKAPKSAGAGAPTVLTGLESCVDTFGSPLPCSADEFRSDASYLYGSGQYSSGIYRVAKANGTVFTYAPMRITGSVWANAVNSTRTYWARSQGATLYLHSVNIDNTRFVETASNIVSNDLLSMVADDCAVYWTDGQSNIWKTPLPVLTHLSVMTPQKLTVAGTSTKRIVVDDTFAYWTDSKWIGRARK